MVNKKKANTRIDTSTGMKKKEACLVDLLSGRNIMTSEMQLPFET